MEFKELESLLGSAVRKGELISCSLSKVRHKGRTPFQKVVLRPVQLRGKLKYQVTYDYPKKQLHKNLDPPLAQKLVLRLLESVFRQGVFFTAEADWQVFVSKKGVPSILRRPPSRAASAPDHDRAKNYILKEGTPYPFLVKLGVMDSSGKVLAKRYHKYRQLNKFLEIVEDCLPHLKKRLSKGALTVVDFGSGRAYLTFALYHYLVQHLGLPVQVVGLDLKKEAVSFGNRVAAALGYEQLRFRQEDIRDFRGVDGVDLVVSLHACDRATDFALAQAVRWGAAVILAVPCCQHELLQQVRNPSQKPLLEHGILKERSAALITDAARAKLLETVGYSVQVLEFVDFQHTVKNLLIRAWQDQGKRRAKAWEEYEKFKEFWRIEPTLETLLREEPP